MAEKGVYFQPQLIGSGCQVLNESDPSLASMDVTSRKAPGSSFSKLSTETELQAAVEYQRINPLQTRSLDDNGVRDQEPKRSINDH